MSNNRELYIPEDYQQLKEKFEKMREYHKAFAKKYMSDKYNNDPAFREKQKKKALEYYYKKKGLSKKENKQKQDEEVVQESCEENKFTKYIDESGNVKYDYTKRYNEDQEYRERKKQQAKEYYHRKKESSKNIF